MMVMIEAIHRNPGSENHRAVGYRPDPGKAMLDQRRPRRYLTAKHLTAKPE
jgi:hypothetical protein